MMNVRLVLFRLNATENFSRISNAHLFSLFKSIRAQCTQNSVSRIVAGKYSYLREGSRSPAFRSDEVCT